MGGAHKCPVCGKSKFERRNSLEICEYCGWQDDALEEEREGYEGGANGMSLKKAKAIFKQQGALDEYFAEQREAVAKGSGPHLCPVCGKYEFPEWHSYEKCAVCGWEDDAVQTTKPDRENRANRMSLNKARAAYKVGAVIE